MSHWDLRLNLSDSTFPPKSYKYCLIEATNTSPKSLKSDAWKSFLSLLTPLHCPNSGPQISCLDNCNSLLSSLPANFALFKNMLTLSSESASKRQIWGFPGGAVVGSLPANAGDMGSSPGLGGSHMRRSN